MNRQESTVLQHEVSQLRGRVAELEQALMDAQQRETPLDARMQQDMRMFQAVVTYTPDAVAVANLEGQLIYANAAMKKMMRYQTDLHGQPISSFHVPEEHPFVHHELMPALFQHGCWQGQLTYLRADGSTFPGHVVTFLIADDHGQPQAIAAIIRDVSERQQVEADLRQSRTLFEQFLNNMPAACYVMDEAGHYLMVNDVCAEAVGYAKEQLVGSLLSNMLPAEVANDWQHHSRQVLARQEPVAREQHVVLPDGPHTFLSTLFPLGETRDGSVMLGGISLDITERQQAAEELRMANQRIEQFLETTPLSTIEFDRNGIITRWNKSAERIFGWTAEEALGQELLPLVVPPICMEVGADAHTTLFTEHVINNRNDNLTRDGQLITCQWYNTVLRDEQGNLVSVLAQTEDVTEQVRQQEELLVFKALAENAPDIVGMARFDTGKMTYANPAHHRLLGYEESIVGMPLTDVFAEDPQHLKSLVQHTFEHGSWSGNINYRRADGSVLPTFLTGFTVRNAQGEAIAVAGIARDITEQLRAEEERAALQEQVLEAQRATVRELSTPLIPIADDVVIMPLIGSIDTLRAQQVMDSLLEGVERHKASTVILDITGVQVVDTQVANTFLQAAQAVRLLGARVVMTGIQPQIAQTLVQLGVSLKGIDTRSTLQAGIAAVLK
jgi:rsbT co-antagonist protein RsbR